MKIVALHNQQSAVAYYRTWIPARILERLGHDVTWWEDMTFKKAMRHNPNKWYRHNGPFDFVLAERPTDRDIQAFFAGMRHYSPNGRLIGDFDDDFAAVPKWNKAHNAYQPGQESYETAFTFLRLCELMTVSTSTLVERYRDKSHAIIHAPNLIDPADWVGLPTDPNRSQDPCIRILYGGASGHYGDLDEARAGLEEFLRHPPCPVRLICMGHISPWLQELRREFAAENRIVLLPWHPFHDYPASVAWGGFDFAIAPLADHPFNLAKSNIKWLEAAVQRIPLLASRIGPYAEIPDGCAIRVANTKDAWKDALTALATDAEIRSRVRDNAFEAVMDQYTLDKGAQIWQTILEVASARPRILTLQDTYLASDNS